MNINNCLHIEKEIHTLIFNKNKKKKNKNKN